MRKIKLIPSRYYATHISTNPFTVHSLVETIAYIMLFFLEDHRLYTHYTGTTGFGLIQCGKVIQYAGNTAVKTLPKPIPCDQGMPFSDRIN